MRLSTTRFTPDSHCLITRTAEYQTKDIEHLLGGASGLGATLREYEITSEGGLRVRVHEREWHGREGIRVLSEEL